MISPNRLLFKLLTSSYCVHFKRPGFHAPPQIDGFQAGGCLSSSHVDDERIILR